MRTWANRIGVALLSISLLEAGMFACCRIPENPAATPASHCHPASPPHPASYCVPSDSLQAVPEQAVAAAERLPSAFAGVLPASPEAEAASIGFAPALESGAVPPDLFLHIHVLRI